MYSEIVNLPKFDHLFFMGTYTEIAQQHYGTDKCPKFTDYSKLYNNRYGDLNTGFFEMLPTSMDCTCKKNSEATAVRQKWLSEIKGDFKELYLRFYMDVEFDEIDDKFINWDQITDNLKSLYPHTFEDAIYGLAGYATENGFNSMFEGFIDKFHKRTNNGVTYYYCISDKLIAYIEIRPSKEQAGHEISFHGTCTNVVFSVVNNTINHIHEKAYAGFYKGLDEAVYTKWRPFRPPTSIKYNHKDDSKTRIKNADKAVNLKNLDKHLKKIFPDSDIVELKTNIFFPGFIKFESATSLFTNHLYELTEKDFTGKFSEKIPENLRTLRATKDSIIRNIDRRVIGLKVDVKKYNGDLLKMVKSEKPQFIIKNNSIFSCFNATGTTQFVAALHEFSYDNHIYAPIAEFDYQCKIWYELSALTEKHNSYRTFKEFIDHVHDTFIIDEVPLSTKYSITKHISNAFHKALYPNSSYNSLMSTWKKIEGKLSTKKIWTKKHSEIAKQFIEQIMLYTNPTSFDDDYIKEKYDNMFKIYVPTDDDNGKYMYIKDASDNFIITHSELVVQYIRSLINCLNEKYNIQSIEAFENYLHTYLESWDNKLRCNMFASNYIDGYIDKSISGLYYKTEDTHSLYKVMSYEDNGVFKVRHIESSKANYFDDGYNDYDYKNLPIFISKNYVLTNLHERCIEKLYKEYITYEKNPDLLDDPDKVKMYDSFEYAKKQWLKYLRKTFTCDDDFNYYLSWYHYKLNNKVVDRNMLNYGNQDCLKSTLANMIIDAGFDFDISTCSDFIDKFDYSVMNHTATLLEELEQLEPSECSGLIKKLKGLFKTNDIRTQDKNVKRFTIDRRVDFDITTNDSTYIASKLFAICPNAITKRICVIERKSLDEKIIRNENKFPNVRNNEFWNRLMVSWIKYEFNTDANKGYKLLTLNEMLSYKSSYKSVELIKEIKDNQHTKISRDMFIENSSINTKFSNTGKLCNLAMVIKDIVTPYRKQYELKLVGLKDLYEFISKRYNVEIFSKPDNMVNVVKNFKDSYDIVIKNSGSHYRLDIDNLDKLVRSFCDYSYSMVVDVLNPNNEVYMLPTIEQMEHGYENKLCTENSSTYTLEFNDESDNDTSKPVDESVDDGDSDDESVEVKPVNDNSNSDKPVNDKQVNSNTAFDYSDEEGSEHCELIDCNNDDSSEGY